MLPEEAYYSRPIALRHPIVFYEGHLPGFSFNTLVKKGLGGPSIDPRLETLFARGIDPHESQAGGHASRRRVAVRDAVRQFADEADARVLDALTREDLDRPGDPLLDRAEAVFSILEHEAMHQETLLYMWHRLPFDEKQRAGGYAPRVDGAAPRRRMDRRFPRAAPRSASTAPPCRSAGTTSFRRARVDVPAFSIERHNVTNAQFLEFVDAGGYRDAQWWRPEDWHWVQSERVEHPLFWERVGRRLALARDVRPGAAAAGVAGVRQPRGGRGVRPLARRAPADRGRVSARGVRQTPKIRRRERCIRGAKPRRTPTHGVFDFSSWDPQPAGSHPAGASAWGVEDLVGNGWEWTSTPFAPFPGFQRDGVVSRVLGGFLRRRALRDEGRVAGDRARAAAADASATGSARGIRTSTRHSGASNDHANHRPPPPTAQFAADVAVLPDARSRASCRRAISTTSSARRCSTPSARCRGTASRAPRRGCSRRTAVRSSRQLPGLTDASSSSGPAAAPSSRRSSKRGRRSASSASICGWSTSRRARSSSPRGRWPRSPNVHIVTYAATYEAGLVQAAGDTAAGRALVLFLGSNIGNFDRPGAEEFLRGIRASLRRGDALLIGADLVKPERDLLLAYDDPLGVTAAFNRNLLVRINRELGGNFDVGPVRPPRGVGARRRRAWKCIW